MLNKILSVIIPVYNVAKFLPECLNSVINQTYENLEIILVNDGSTDDSGKICDKYALKDDRIKVIHKKNGGLSDARNTGLKVSTGDLIAFLDSDDYLAKDFYEKLITRLQNDNSDIAIGETYYVYPDQIKTDDRANYYNFKSNKKIISSIADKSNLIYSCACWNKVYKSELIRNNNLKFPYGLYIEDVPFTFSSIVYSNRISLVKGAILYYRRQEQSILATAKKNRIPFDIFSIYDICEEFLNNVKLNNTDKNEYKKILNNFEIFNIVSWFFSTSQEYRQEFFQVMKTKFKDLKIYKNNYIDNWNKLNYFLVLLNKRYDNFEIWYLLLQKIKNIFNLRKWKKKFKYYIPRIINIIYFQIQFFLNRFYKNSNYNNNDLEIKVNDLEDENNKLIYNKLKELKDFYFLPNRGNLGDMAIATASYTFFDSLNLQYNIIDMTDYKRYLKMPINLVYGGGGLFTKYYKQDYQEILEIFKSKDLKKIIVLPASFYECDDILEIFDERFTIFCRERQSYDYCLSKNNKAQFILANDMVLSLSVNFINPKIKNNNNSIKLSKSQKTKLKKLYRFYTYAIYKYNRVLKYSTNIGYFFRTDKESIPDEKKRKISLIDLSLVAQSFCADKSFTYIMTKLFLKVLNSYDFIVTDRLHIAICSALLNKRVFILDNQYKKLSNVLENSMTKYQNIKMYDNIDELIYTINKLNLNIKKNKTRINILSFNEFLNEWQAIKQNFGPEKIYWSEIL